MKRTLNVCKHSIPFAGEGDEHVGILTKISSRSPGLKLLDSNQICQPRFLCVSEYFAFLALPTELIHSTFDYLNGHELSLFSTCSRRSCSIVFNYASSRIVRNRIFPMKLRHSQACISSHSYNVSTPFITGSTETANVVSADVQYSLLVLFSTQNKSQPERARIFVNWLQEMLCPPPKSMALFSKRFQRMITQNLTPHCLNYASCIGLFAAGAFLYMVSARNSHTQECLNLIFNHLNSKFDLEAMILRILETPSGKYSDCEFYLRIFILRLFVLPGICNAELSWSAFWLQRLMKPLCYYNRAKLMLLLTAPFDSHTMSVTWGFLNQPAHLSLNPIADLRFADLGDLLRIVNSEKVMSDQEFLAMFSYIFKVEVAEASPYVEAFVLSAAGPKVAGLILKWTLNPTRQLPSNVSTRLHYVVDVLFYMIGASFSSRKTKNFVQVLELVKYLSEDDVHNPNFQSTVAFMLGHRLAAELWLDNSMFREGVVARRDDSLVFIGHLMSILFQRSIR